MTTSLDETRVAAFGEKLVGTYVGGTVTLMVDLAARTGLLDALAMAPSVSGSRTWNRVSPGSESTRRPLVRPAGRA